MGYIFICNQSIHRPSQPGNENKGKDPRSIGWRKKPSDGGGARNGPNTNPRTDEPTENTQTETSTSRWVTHGRMNKRAGANERTDIKKKANERPHRQTDEQEQEREQASWQINKAADEQERTDVTNARTYQQKDRRAGTRTGTRFWFPGCICICIYQCILICI